MGFATYLGKRVARMVLSLVAVSMITFTLLQMAPGSFADIQRISAGAAQFGGAGTEDMVHAFASRYGDDIPAWQQYLIFMKGAVTWDFGPSYKYPTQDVQDIIAQGFPISATIAIIAVVLSLMIAIPIGVYAAVRQNSKADHSAMFLITLGTALPNYLTGVILVLFFTLTLGVLPSSGWDGPQYMIMPVLALVLGPTAVLARYVRSSMLETLREEYVVAALAKGGRHATVITRHALRNSLIPIVTVLGPLLASLMTGTVFVEALFRIPGLGLYFAQAAASRDMPLLMGTALFFALILMTMNLIVDLVYGYLDPRIRAAGGVSRWRSQQKRSVSQTA
ncbi:ABC transporter permease [Phytoactinopolyspora mesophila]|uniref:ABC transporter permease subunit n=1 Tax=Phytoactinopolyspora mesophila TaxID=2650750 RepID=A0A7K3M5M8_9ACTN|nr:ABC transporter permease [Phytoactinopolyspora mesophila]NDL58232.1 ABC transporter permease subunit [Phytoactinopolyspora mesophila]